MLTVAEDSKKSPGHDEFSKLFPFSDVTAEDGTRRGPKLLNL